MVAFCKELLTVSQVLKTLGKNWARKERLWLYIERTGLGNKNNAVT